MAQVAAQLSGSLGGPLCWRCRGVGDQGSDVCKFCGARYADDPAGGAAPAGAAEAPAQAAAPAQPEPAQPPAAQPQAAPQAEAPAPAAASSAAPKRAPATTVISGSSDATPPRAQLVAILKDGSDGDVFPLRGDQVDLGRTEGDIVLEDDPYIDRRHARLRFSGGTWSLTDLDSLNGIYLRLRASVEIVDGDFLLVGQQVLRFEALSDGELPLGPANLHGVLVFGTPEVPRVARLVQYTTEGVGRDVHYCYRSETVMGRETGDIVFTDDPFLSRRHAVLRADKSSGKFSLEDLGSSNGTAVRLKGPHTLSPGDQFRVGRHLFRFDDLTNEGQPA